MSKTQWQKSSPIVASAGTGTMLATLIIAALTHYAGLAMSADVKSAITEKLHAEKLDTQIQTYIENLKKDSYIFKPGEKK